MGTPSDLERFFGYVRAFELANLTSHWSLLEPCFSEDACHLVDDGGVLGGDDHGRAAVIDGPARQRATGTTGASTSRIPEILEGPITRPDGIWMRWALTLRRAGLPELRIERRSPRGVCRRPHPPPRGARRARRRGARRRLPRRARGAPPSRRRAPGAAGRRATCATSRPPPRAASCAATPAPRASRTRAPRSRSAATTSCSRRPPSARARAAATRPPRSSRSSSAPSRTTASSSRASREGGAWSPAGAARA